MSDDTVSSAATPDVSATALSGVPTASTDRTRTVDLAKSGVSAELIQRQKASIPGYELFEEIHRGGQGVVYRARQLATKRIVAVKMLLSGRFASDWDRLRFRREIDLAASLSHPNIVTIFDSGDVEGIPFFAMEYVLGQPLTRWASALSLKSDGSAAAARPTPPASRAPRSSSRLRRQRLRTLLDVFIKVCDAVAYSHRRGVIHRDLKPGNILVDAHGEPHVLDFGLARLLEGSPSGEAELTRTGEFMGTLAYASPEQARGDRAQVDIRTDVYSLGVILFQLLTERFPYDVQSGTALERLQRIQSAEPLLPSRLEPLSRGDLEVIVLKALAKEPERRYASAADLVSDLRAWLRGEAISARRDNLFYVLRKLARRHWPAASIVGLLGVIIVSFAAVSYLLYLDREQELTRRKAAEQGQVQIAQLAERGLSQRMASERLRALMHFLLEWHAGRIELAQQIQSSVDRGRPEWRCMEFLLTPGADASRFTAELGAQNAALAHFCLGERSLRMQDLAAARAHFARALASVGARPDLRPTIDARLTQLPAAP